MVLHQFLDQIQRMSPEAIARLECQAIVNTLAMYSEPNADHMEDSLPRYEMSQPPPQYPAAHTISDSSYNIGQPPQYPAAHTILDSSYNIGQLPQFSTAPTAPPPYPVAAPYDFD